MRHLAILLLLLPAILAPGGEGPGSPLLTNRPFKLRLRGVEPATVTAASFWVTADDGATWKRAHRVENDGTEGWRAVWTFDPKEDGRYGFRITGAYVGGREDPAPQPGEAPDPTGVVTVDRTPPTIVEVSHRLGTDLKAVIAWRVEDPHLGATPVALQWRDREGTWYQYDRGARFPAKGEHATNAITAEVVAMRLLVEDLAGNRRVGALLPLALPAREVAKLPPEHDDPPPEEPPKEPRGRRILAEMAPGSRFEEAMLAEDIEGRLLAKGRPADGPEARLFDARKALADGRNADAKELYRELRKEAIARLSAADEMDLLRLQEKPEEALRLRWRVPPEAEGAPLRLAQARALIALGRVADAESVLAAISTEDPCFSEARYLLAWCHLTRGQEEAGIQLLAYVATFNDAWGRLAASHLVNQPER